MSTRQLMKWMFTDGEFALLIVFAVAGFVWGLIDRLTGRCD